MYRRMRTRCLILLLSGEHITQHILKMATSGKPRVYAQNNVNPHRANILHKYYSFEVLIRFHPLHSPMVTTSQYFKVYEGLSCFGVHKRNVCHNQGIPRLFWNELIHRSFRRNDFLPSSTYHFFK